MSIFRQTTKIILWATLILVYTACYTPINDVVKPAIIPVPLVQNIHEGTFLINNDTQLVYDADFKPVALFLKGYIENGSKIRLKTSEEAHKIAFIKDTTIKNTEGYQLKVSKKAEC